MEKLASYCAKQFQHALFHLILKCSCAVGFIFILISQVRKPRLRETKKLVQVQIINNKGVGMWTKAILLQSQAPNCYTLLPLTSVPSRYHLAWMVGGAIVHNFYPFNIY